MRQLGDILLTTPIATTIKQAEPDSRVAFLTHPMGKLILEDHPQVDRTFFYDPQGGMRAFASLVQQLRREHFDVAFDFMNNPRSVLYTLAAGARATYAFRSKRTLFFSATLPRPTSGDYIVREKNLLLPLAGLPTLGSEKLVLPWQATHLGPWRQFAQEVLAGDETRPRVILSPTHRREARQWPLSAYAALADRLIRDWQAAVIWLWGPGEESWADQGQALTHNPTYKAPKTAFREMAAFMAQCDLFIGNSNGPSHVAVATDIPSLQIHGPTLASAWCPMTHRHRAVSSPRISGLAQPLSTLSVDAVWEATAAMLPLVQEKASQGRQNGVKKSWNALI